MVVVLADSTPTSMSYPLQQQHTAGVPPTQAQSTTTPRRRNFRTMSRGLFPLNGVGGERGVGEGRSIT